MRKAKEKDEAHVRHLVEEILVVCGDTRSTPFYAKVARVLPDEVIFQYLSEIRQDESIRNRGAVFTSKVKGYLGRQGKSRVGGLTEGWS